jgi:preprotein translocase subunit SecY
MNESVVKIPVQQIGQGMVSEENKVHYLPIKVNSAGVIPVIFAASLMSIPSTVQIFYDTKS